MYVQTSFFIFGEGSISTETTTESTSKSEEPESISAEATNESTSDSEEPRSNAKSNESTTVRI